MIELRVRTYYYMSYVYMSYVDYFGCLVGWYYYYVCNLTNVK